MSPGSSRTPTREARVVSLSLCVLQGGVPTVTRPALRRPITPTRRSNYVLINGAGSLQAAYRQPLLRPMRRHPRCFRRDVPEVCALPRHLTGSPPDMVADQLLRCSLLSISCDDSSALETLGHLDERLSSSKRVAVISAKNHKC